MILTAKQVREKLGLGKRTLEKLAEAGLLKPINQRKEGATKFYANYDSRAVEEYRKAHNPKSTLRRKTEESAASKNLFDQIPPSPMGLNTRLARIEQKLDNLLKIWS